MAYEVLEKLTRENIYNRLDSIEIFKKYCGDFHDPGKLFKSPFRKEKKPSCSIAWIRGDFYLKDFGSGNGWRPIEFVMQKFGLSWHEALAKINNDFTLGLSGGEYLSSNIITLSPKQYKETEQSVIKIKRRELQQHDIDYWMQYGIDNKTLELFDVVPISHFSINGNVYYADKLAYSYEFYWDTPTHFSRKIYQPYSEWKWFSTGRGIVQGEGVLPYHNHLLIITSSLKDCMVWHTMGFNSVAPTSETSFLSDDYFNKQKSRFDRIVLQFDNDETGISRSKELSEKYGLEYIFSPEKDISDTYKKFGKEKTMEIVKNLLIL
jgi:hypothetical protein